MRGIDYLVFCGWTPEDAERVLSDRDKRAVEYTREHPQCVDGFHVFTENSAPKAVPCNCARKNPWDLRLAKLQDKLGKGYTWEALDRARQPEAYDLLARVVAEWPCGALLTGPTGTGKTHAVKALVYEATKRQKKAEFIHAGHLARTFAEACGFDGTADEARERLETLKKADVLVVDDLGSQRATESNLFQEQFQLLVDEARGLLFITTNDKPEDMRNKLGAKVLSRIGERCARIDFRGLDQRRHHIVDDLRAAHA